jgi:hypothetical protein
VATLRFHAILESAQRPIVLASALPLIPVFAIQIPIERPAKLPEPLVGL